MAPEEAEQQVEAAAASAEAGEAPQPAADVAADVDASAEIPAGQEEAAEEPAEPEIAFSWQASEFVHHHKSMMWYGILGLVVIALASLAIWLHLWLEIGVFVIGGGAVVVYARKPPRTLTYELSSDGIIIDGKPHPFGEYRSFSVMPDEEWHSIDLEPVKRLNPRTALLFDSKDFEEIVGHLELHLPREDRELDVIEKVSRYVRF